MRDPRMSVHAFCIGIPANHAINERTNLTEKERANERMNERGNERTNGRTKERTEPTKGRTDEENCGFYKCPNG